AVLPVFSLLVVGSYIFGALTIKDFALALFIGLMTGAYSSIFVATPILAMLKEREPRYIAIRQRVATAQSQAKGGGATFPITSLQKKDATEGQPDADGETEDREQVGVVSGVRRPPTPRRPPPPRPRKKPKRK